MIIIGIDAGVENTKVVVLKDNEVVGAATISTGGIDRPETAKKAFNEALESAGVSEKDVEQIIATGKGKFDIPFSTKRITETNALAQAVKYLDPNATVFMSLGADETITATLGEEKPINEYAINQKCAAGIGTFLKYLSKRLELSLDDITPGLTDVPAINDGCVVFAELDALSLLNSGVEPKLILASAINAAAVRAANVFNDITAENNKHPMLVGGLAKSAAFVDALQRALNIEFNVPDNAEFAGAIGAAISGRKS